MIKDRQELIPIVFLFRNNIEGIFELFWHFQTKNVVLFVRKIVTRDFSVSKHVIAEEKDKGIEFINR